MNLSQVGKLKCLNRSQFSSFVQLSSLLCTENEQLVLAGHILSRRRATHRKGRNLSQKGSREKDKGKNSLTNSIKITWSNTGAST